MDPDEIGGSCPRCDAEFRPGVTVCPDCGIPLLGVDELAASEPAAPRRPAALGIDPRWSTRLLAFAAVAAIAVALAVASGIVTALSYPDDFGRQILRQRRVQLLTQVANPTTATIVLVAGLAVAGARFLGDQRRPARVLAFGAAALVGGLAIVGAGADLLWGDAFLPFGNQLSTMISRAAVLLLALVGGWLTDAWVVDDREPIVP